MNQDRLQQEIDNFAMAGAMAKNTDQPKHAERMFFVHDCLVLLKEILDSGDCNTCKKKRECVDCPKIGGLVRFNCKDYEKEGGEE